MAFQVNQGRVFWSQCKGNKRLSNSILPCFRDIADFLLRRATWILGCSPWIKLPYCCGSEVRRP